MSLRYRSSDGTEQIIAGLTPGGDIEAGAVATRSGTETFTSLGSGNVETYNITFDSDLPDANYIVTFEFTTNTGSIVATSALQTASGFVLYIRNVSVAAQTGTVKWTATKTYTVQHDIQNSEAIADIQAAMPSDAGSANKLVTKSYVDNADSSLGTRVSSIEDTIPATASITNKLATAADVAGIEIDKLTDINDVNTNTLLDGQTLIWDDAYQEWKNGQAGKVYTAGDGIEISNLDAISADNTLVPFNFVGTQAEWDALSVSQKAKYNLVTITDDVANGGVAISDVVADGNMNAVTSNAVYDALLQQSLKYVDFDIAGKQLSGTENSYHYGLLGTVPVDHVPISVLWITSWDPGLQFIFNGRQVFGVSDTITTIPSSTSSGRKIRVFYV